MLQEAAEQYSKYLSLDLNKKLLPIHQSIDEMLTRLEEFETMLTIVQQERCNTVGLTGSLTQAVDSKSEFKEVCKRIDALEKLIEHIKNNIDAVERKIEAAEEHYGLTDNTAKIKSLLIPLFKKNVSVRGNTNEPEVPMFSTADYFVDENTTGTSS